MAKKKLTGLKSRKQRPINLGNYRLLPQGKIFMFFSGNTSKYVLEVQNRLLFENLRKNQQIDWQPTAWNVAGHIDTFGEERNAQSVIDEFASEADNIVFVVKDEICKGLQHEWNLWTNNSLGKRIHLLIYDNKNASSLHNTLDPNEKIVYSRFKSFQDIFIYILTEIAPLLELKGDLHKLRFVKTISDIQSIEVCLRTRVDGLRKNGASPYVIGRFEQSIKDVENNHSTILENSYSTASIQLRGFSVMNQPNSVRIDATNIAPSRLIIPIKSTFIKDSVKEVREVKGQQD